MKLHWKELGVAFLLSLALWYMVTGSEKVETQVEVRVEYRGQPGNLKIKSGLVSKLTVRVRGSRGLLRSASMQDLPYSMDLSGLVKGMNVIPIPKEKLPFWSGVEVMDVSPSVLQIDTDIAVVKSVPLEAEITGEVPQEFQVTAAITPPTVQLRGASEVMDDLKTLKVPVPFTEGMGPGQHTVRQRLVPPEGMDATPNEVIITLDVQEKRKEVSVTRQVTVPNLPDQFGVFIRPDKVTLRISVPEGMAAGIASNKDIAAVVRLENPELGSYTLPVRASLPPGVRLVKIDPQQTSVTLEQKNSSGKK